MTEVQQPIAGFASPFDVPTPPGAEGWEEMYPYYLLFDDARRDEDDQRFWFYNGMHFPEPMPPFDMITAESCYLSIGRYQGRVFSIPTVLGIEHRVVNGYVYITANEVTDPEPRARLVLDVREQYRNMRRYLDRAPSVLAAAEAAIRAEGIVPVRKPIRGGTDGSRLSEMGLPTPNLFTGGNEYHSVREWASLQDMAAAAATIIHLAEAWTRPEYAAAADLRSRPTAAAARSFS